MHEGRQAYWNITYMCHISENMPLGLIWRSFRVQCCCLGFVLTILISRGPRPYITWQEMPETAKSISEVKWYLTLWGVLDWEGREPQVTKKIECFVSYFKKSGAEELSLLKIYISMCSHLLPLYKQTNIVVAFKCEALERGLYSEGGPSHGS